jgi:hypothetical protein
MADGSDFDGVVVFQIEEDPVIAAAETEAGERGLQFFYVTSTAGEVAIHAVKNLHGRFAVDRAESYPFPASHLLISIPLSHFYFTLGMERLGAE